MTLTQERRKHRITPETLVNGREFHDCPTPVDPGLRQYRQQSCIDAARALHQALGRSPSEHASWTPSASNESRPMYFAMARRRWRIGYRHLL
jgi:hypothetical protein